ncbi:DegT/DnrJ/EryC1/StrS family aminotransferase [Glycomyces buryatensis]|uniref:DegT/DnrJ/EryC1/StrS family aminotransferase n=1 Tax=Glycomyces buryatensis TaxID=2570927 RepID=A0A4S8Q4T3_9ACTN|nr:DegT/DnrJ/EryC1/StrS family aminotransferase [Glycomyces buryatensis]THV37622.1 DegT/DnrJ/EryC1/StrS family aminotransferase [Glycomyces buryatensis]
MKPRLALCGGPPAVDVALQSWPPYDARIAAEVDRMLQSAEVSYYGEEGHVAVLEEKFERYHSVRYALATSSGTAALHSAFVACGLRPGDEVIAPTHTFLATVMPVFAADATPVLVDCESDTEGIDPGLVEKAVTERTKAIVVTHLWGHPVDMDAIMAIARSHGLKVVEDCSHAHGATHRGRVVGSIGDVGCFSLQGKKAVSGGQGGILVTDDEDIYERALLLGHFRVRAEQGVRSPGMRQFADTGWGLNYRMHPFSAVMANATFDRLDEVVERRRERHGRLLELLRVAPGVDEPHVGPEVTMGAWYGIKPRYRPEELDGLPIDLYIEALRAEGVKIGRPGSAPLHLSPMFNGASAERMPFAGSPPEGRRAYLPGDLPVSESIHDCALSLPTFTYEPLEIVEQYGEAFAKVADGLDDLQRIAKERAHG